MLLHAFAPLLHRFLLLSVGYTGDVELVELFTPFTPFTVLRVTPCFTVTPFPLVLYLLLRKAPLEAPAQEKRIIIKIKHGFPRAISKT